MFVRFVRRALRDRAVPVDKSAPRKARDSLADRFGLTASGFHQLAIRDDQWSIRLPESGLGSPEQEQEEAKLCVLELGHQVIDQDEGRLHPRSFWRWKGEFELGHRIL